MEDEKPIGEHYGLFLMKCSSKPNLMNSFLYTRRNKEDGGRGGGQGGRIYFYDRDIRYHRSDKIPIIFGETRARREQESRDGGREMD